MLKHLTVEDLKRANFEPIEFYRSDTANRLGINNIPDNYLVLENLMRTADFAQKLRELLGFPIRITSGYRCSDLNSAVGGVPDSQHIVGEALDFVCPKFGTPENIVRFIKETGLGVDQCIIENNSWVHVSIRRENNRNQFAVIKNNEFTLLA